MIERGKRILVVSPAWLVSFLSKAGTVFKIEQTPIPADATISHMALDPYNNKLLVFIESAEFSPVRLGDATPELPGIQLRTLRPRPAPMGTGS